MSYQVGNKEIVLKCNICGASLKGPRGQDRLQSIRDLWKRAESKGWVSSSEQHICNGCS